MNPPPLCPGPDLLEQYRKGELAPTQAAELQAHLATCGLCSILVERLDSFDAIAQAQTPPTSREWERLQPRIDHQFQRKTGGHPAHPSTTARQPSLLAQPTRARVVCCPRPRLYNLERLHAASAFHPSSRHTGPPPRSQRHSRPRRRPDRHHGPPQQYTPRPDLLRRCPARPDLLGHPYQRVWSHHTPRPRHPAQ
ncbi:MAG: zf-HC2 domain-containing protein [Bryobacterales bacterium]|nr:zf-HC2 domain-containing protein [Bryobacterales bacterium]